MKGGGGKPYIFKLYKVYYMYKRFKKYFINKSQPCYLQAKCSGKDLSKQANFHTTHRYWFTNQLSLIKELSTPGRDKNALVERRIIVRYRFNLVAS